MRFDLNQALGIHQQGLLMRSKRAELIAGNLANVDTPNYKARDIDFKAVLQRIHSNETHNRLATTQRGHISGADQIGGTSIELLYKAPTQPSLDGNTVDGQLEKAAFAENAIQYQASLRFLSGKIKALLTAIRGE